MASRAWPLPGVIAAISIAALAACSQGGLSRDDGSPFAPGVDPSGDAVSGVEVGHRLMQSGQHELALEAFSRAAYDEGLTAEILVGLGSANLGLGRLGQSERLLRRATELQPDWPGAWNNLGVVVMERGRIEDAIAIFRRAFSMPGGQSDAIRDNLRLALSKRDARAGAADAQAQYRLVREGRGIYTIRPNDG
ncbi:tetratricopeptide repeat protein [Cognatishimia sp. F0-27]|uniref:tetratricopeptide repeat protein n=1 Tax=Cognatishimia sp. F0-27 TaxID=2816855 RepID=UPI001D0C136F|nr:tetratricopeptide repeat protein [Cognatishimia sp. F0-27]MCC1492262.1 tetratricopeptide repeat protein [Cognatishimia sp. F0-27]